MSGRALPGDVLSVSGTPSLFLPSRDLLGSRLVPEGPKTLPGKGSDPPNIENKF